MKFCRLEVPVLAIICHILLHVMTETFTLHIKVYIRIKGEIK